MRIDKIVETGGFEATLTDYIAYGGNEKRKPKPALTAEELDDLECDEDEYFL